MKDNNVKMRHMLDWDQFHKKEQAPLPEEKGKHETVKDSTTEGKAKGGNEVMDDPSTKSTTGEPKATAAKANDTKVMDDAKKIAIKNEEGTKLTKEPGVEKGPVK